MNDSSTIYISHSDNIPHNHEDEGRLLSPSSTPVDNMTLSKKVAQNRAAQRAFRERKQHYVEDLENKAKQLDAWKRAMIQLQADNDCLRKTVTRLEDQLKQFIVAGSTLPAFTPLQPSPQQQQTAPVPPPLSLSSAPVSTSSPSPLSNEFDPSPPSPPSSTYLSSSSSSVSSPSSSAASASSSPPPASSTSFTSSLSDQTKRKSQLSKREKKRQRLLADEKLYQNDDLEPIQLHCPMAFNNIPAPAPQPTMIKPKEEDLDLYHPFSPTSPPSSIVSEVHPFSNLPALESHDQYINFADDDIPSSSSSSCSSSYLHLI